MLICQNGENRLDLANNCNNKCQLLLLNNQNLCTLSPTASSSASTTSSHSKYFGFFNLIIIYNLGSGIIRFDEFKNEGQALKNLMRFLSRTLRDSGTFDDECEKKIEDYRFEWQDWCCDNLFFSTSPYNCIKSPVTASRSRSFSTNLIDNRYLNSMPNSSTLTSSTTSTLSTTSSFLVTSPPVLTVVSPTILISSASLSTG